jgi:Na+:H+ antiporter, NhaA family
MALAPSDPLPPRRTGLHAGHDSDFPRARSEPQSPLLARNTLDPTLAPPEISPRAAAIVRRLVSPIEAFLHVEAASGLVLLAATVAALVLANSGLAETYHHLLEARAGVRLGARSIDHTVHFWVNEGLMTVFFFVVGLEIRREVHEGELANPRRALLPISAAIGGMVVPALAYYAVSAGHPLDVRGWGVPMATDIAFALGALALLGKRVTPALRVMLLAVAIIDDIGSILVIALFYSEALTPAGFVVAGAGVAMVLAMQRFGVRNASAYVIPGAVIWLGILWSGIHPTIAGVVIGLLTPARAWLGPKGLSDFVRDIASTLDKHLGEKGDAAANADALAREAAKLARAQRELLAPATRLQLALHPWVAFAIMPMFALANAGITFGSDGMTRGATTWGILVGLLLGKPLGVALAVVLAKTLLRAPLPLGVAWREIAVLGCVAGVGFTMALFIASLAYDEGPKLEEAKLAVLIASGLAFVGSLVLGRALLRPSHPGAAETATDAEASDPT